MRGQMRAQVVGQDAAYRLTNGNRNCDAGESVVEDEEHDGRREGCRQLYRTEHTGLTEHGVRGQRGEDHARGEQRQRVLTHVEHESAPRPAAADLVHEQRDRLGETGDPQPTRELPDLVGLGDVLDELIPGG